jgi:hypothetical protein
MAFLGREVAKATRPSISNDARIEPTGRAYRDGLARGQVDAVDQPPRSCYASSVHALENQPGVAVGLGHREAHATRATRLIGGSDFSSTVGRVVMALACATGR